MTRLGRRLEALTVTAFAPDRRVEGRLRSGRVDVRFHETDLHRRLDAAELGNQLERLLGRLAAARARQRRDILAEFGFEAIAVECRDDGYRRFRRAVERVRGAGESPGGGITVATVGLCSFAVSLDAAAVAAMDELDFRAGFRAAATAMAADYGQRSRRLKHEMIAGI